jgi:hypothetical protein
VDQLTSHKEVLQPRPTDSMLDYFEKQAARNPHAIAIIRANERLTYRELDRRANQLAWHIKRLLVLFDTRNLNGAIRPLVRNKAVGSLHPELNAHLPTSEKKKLITKIRGHSLRWSVLKPKEKVVYIWNQIEVRVRHVETDITVQVCRFLGKRLPDPVLLYGLRKSHLHLFQPSLLATPCGDVFLDEMSF